MVMNRVFLSRVMILSMLILSMVLLGLVQIHRAYALETEKQSNILQLDTITVTSEKRESDVQKVPSSVTVIDETQLNDFEINDTLDLMSITPNLYFIEMGKNGLQNTASMRGVVPASDGKLVMGVYVDDVPYYNLDFSLYDIQRIEVLRGPQGTLYGRNSEAGVINIITKKPSSEWEGSLGLEAGSFNSYKMNASVSGPVLRDKLGFKAAVKYSESDGYFENQYDDSKEAGSSETLDGRFTFTATPSDILSFTLTTDFQQYDSPEYANFALLDSHDLRKAMTVDFPGDSSKDAQGVSLRTKVQLKGMKLVSVTSARSEDSSYNNDVDFSSVDLKTMTTDIDVDSYTQELRLVSDKPGSSLQWLGGLYLMNEKVDSDYSMWMNFMNMGMGVPGETLYWDSKTDTLGTALFGEATYRFASKIELTLGLRYDHEQVDFDYSLYPSGSVLGAMGYSAYTTSNDETFDAWLPKAAVSYHFSDKIMPYFSVSRGYRTGGFNSSDKIGTPYDPEFSWNYELGTKTSWFNDRLRFNVCVFYIDLTDMIVDVMASDGLSSYIDNAAKATSKGVEFELTVRPVKGLNLVAGAAFNDTEYEDYCQGADVYDGNHVLYSPKYTFNLGGTYRFDNGIFLNANYHHVGKMYYDTANSKAQGDYGLFDAKIGYETERFDIYLFAANLFDQDYVTRAFESSGVWYGRAGSPRTIGAAIQIRF